ncbi:formylglycine-generating enzyme family protein [Planktothrix paucivesiculata]|uniref:Serine/threonine protein kinase n=1 Tax=Planktothrix paucivesiculata PCC 9631 TaxID=671071 RepID=A0A7Z9BW34_9CYAN
MNNHQDNAYQNNLGQEEETKRQQKEFEFDVITVNAEGNETKRERCRAEFFKEDLGNNISLEMVSIPGGNFMMGAAQNEAFAKSNEYPQHQVNIAAFSMAKYPITQAQWEAIMRYNPSNFKGANRPVQNVNWYSAQEFCQRLSQKTGKTYRLPSEAEWEYACRAQTTSPFHFGESIHFYSANYNGTDGTYREQTTDVGSFQKPNAFGLYDMHGNVWEWCADPWHDNYNGAPDDGSVWESGGNTDSRVMRGGSWNDDPWSCHSATRFKTWPTGTFKNIGLRVVSSSNQTLWKIAMNNHPDNAYQYNLGQEEETKRQQKEFEFDVITVNAQGNETKREHCRAEFFKEDLGNNISLEMVSIPGGNFMMGAAQNEANALSNEYPRHQVNIAAFSMAKYPITQAQWEAIMGYNFSNFKGANRPVEMVNWNDAQVFCQRLSQKTGKTYRLPSQAEWEYACRAKTTSPFHFGETITADLANYPATCTYGSGPKGTDRGQTTDVGSFPPNAFGLYDMHGNVWELCADPWHENYKGAPTDGSVWESGGNTNSRVMRGGSWANHPRDCRSASCLDWHGPGHRSKYHGFRVVSLPPAWTL